MIEEKDLKRIADALDWYEATDGSEREDAANEMYNVLTDIYNQFSPCTRR